MLLKAALRFLGTRIVEENSCSETFFLKARFQRSILLVYDRSKCSNIDSKFKFDTVGRMYANTSTIALASVVALLCGYLWNQWRNKRKGYPDGPTPLPLIGNLHQVIAAGDVVSFIDQTKQIYGNVFSIELGGVIRVVISDYNLIHELFVKNADFTSTRTPDSMPPHMQEVASKTPGLLWAPAPSWKEMRSLALTSLREEGMGKTSLEPKILEELHVYLDHFIEPNLGKPIEITRSVTYVTANIILQMLTARRYDYDEPDLQKLNQIYDDCVKANMRSALTKNLPFLHYLPGDLTGQKIEEIAARFTHPLISDWASSIRKSLNQNSPSSFFEQAIVQAMDDKAKGNQETIFNDKNVGIAILQIFGAGTETTATVLRWILLFMILYPEIQKKVRKEIDQQIGERDATVKDRRQMPYTDAVICEALRIGNTAPTALPHTLERSIVLGGQEIPAGAELMINMASMLRDEKLFPEPNKFKPERFMGPDADYLKSRSAAFGLGRRACLGEALAKMELFLFFTTFLQKYKIRSPEGQKLSSTPIVTIVSAPMIYEIICERRD